TQKCDGHSFHDAAWQSMLGIVENDNGVRIRQPAIEIAGKVGNPLHSERAHIAYPGRHGMQETSRAFRVHANLGRYLDFSIGIELVRPLNQRHDLRQRRDDGADVFFAEHPDWLQLHSGQLTMCSRQSDSAERTSHPAERITTCSSGLSRPSTLSIFGSGVIAMPASRIASSIADIDGGSFSRP